MERGQPFQDNTYATIERRLLKGGAISVDHIVNSAAGNMDGNYPQQQVPHWSTASYLPGSFPFSTAPYSDMDPLGNEGNGDSFHSVGQSILWAPTLADVSCPRDPRRSILAH